MELRTLTEEGVANLLRVQGASKEGLASVTENGITGMMLLEFCEEDIRDAFGVFKDRFLVRKIVRECKSQAHKSNDNTRVTERESHESPPDVLPRQCVANTASGESQLRTGNSVHHWDRQSSVPPPSRCSSGVDRVQVKVEQDSGVLKVPCRDNSSSPASVNVRQTVRPALPAVPSQHPVNVSDHRRSAQGHVKKDRQCHAKRFMETDFSEAGEAQNDNGRMKIPKTEWTQPFQGLQAEKLYKDIEHLSRPSADLLWRKDGSIDEQSKLDRSFDESDSIHVNSVATRDSAQPYKDTWQVNTQSSSVSPTTEGSTDSFYLCQVATTHFSPSDLLVKKEKRGKPTEAQRLCQIVIRNAAVAAQLWETTPLLKDITEEQKAVFYQHVLADAPQLHGYKEALWNKLRECLQNRRKYLLDKEMGKRLPKHAREYLSNEKLLKQRQIKEERTSDLVDLTE